MSQSHESLRDLNEVTGFELDALFEAAPKSEGCIGTRMTEAGLGGCTVSLVYRDALPDFAARVAQGYQLKTRRKQNQAKTGLTPTFYICDIGDGAREITGEVEGCPF
ncbi:galactokinase [Effusibacillus pohliae]|uniref:hypothetical protein n=1 Tax=Effusibacillus pohliae TaxID=232270 RepID=UPI00037BA5BD|nr:hypothetical protein [Effusibacillus pohliae]